jgi:HEAT repeat protein
LRIQAATQLILNDLRNPFHTEHALEALGKIGADEAYNEIREYIVEHPENAVNSLMPLARTGKQRSIRNLRRYLKHANPDLREAAIRALATVACEETLRVLKEHLSDEEDEGVRSSLFEAINSLTSLLLPQTMGMTMHTSAAAPRSTNSDLPV